MNFIFRLDILYGKKRQLLVSYRVRFDTQMLEEARFIISGLTKS